MITTYIDIQNTLQTTTSASYTPSDLTLGGAELDKSKYDGNVEFRAAHTMEQTGGTPDGNVAYSILHDFTNNIEITDSEGAIVGSYVPSAWKRFTGHLASYAAPMVVYPKGKATGGATNKHLKSFIKISQTGFITKTRHFWPMASYNTVATITPAEDSDPKRMTYTSANFSGTVTPYLHATLLSSTSSAVHMDVYNITAGAAVTGSQIDSTSITPEYKKSGTFTLITGNEYTVRRWADSTNSVSVRNAFLVLDQEDTAGISKYETPIQVCNRPNVLSDTIYTPVKSMIVFDASDWKSLTYTMYCHYTRAHSIAGLTSNYDTTDDTTQIASSEVTTTTAGYDTIVSGNVTIPTGDGNVIDNRLKVNALSTVLSSGRFIAVVTAVKHERMLSTLGVGM